MSKTNETKNVATDDVPIATLVINEYKNINDRLNQTNDKLQKSNENLQKANKRVTLLALLLLVLFAIETTYIILYWEAMHPDHGVFQIKCDE